MPTSNSINLRDGKWEGGGEFYHCLGCRVSLKPGTIALRLQTIIKLKKNYKLLILNVMIMIIFIMIMNRWASKHANVSHCMSSSTWIISETPPGIFTLGFFAQ